LKARSAMDDGKTGQAYASMREYTQMSALHRNLENENEADSSEADILESMDLGRGRKTANDMKQWIFVVRKANVNGLPDLADRTSDETQPLIAGQHRRGLSIQSATDALDMVHSAQTRNTLEMDIRRTDLHISPVTLPPTLPSPVPNAEFLYVGISERRMRHWCDRLEYQLNLDPQLCVEWLLMIDNQLAFATHNDAAENRQFNLKCWRDLYVRYYQQQVNEHIYKFYRKYGYGYDEFYAKDAFRVATDSNMYSRDISHGSIFREVDRIRLTKFSFQTNLSSTMNHGFLSTFPVDQLDKRIKDEHNVLMDAYPCHEYDVLADIYAQIWGNLKCTSPASLFQIPLSGLRDYFGEKLTYYFLFLVTYTRYMLPVASVGFFFQIYQLTNNDVEVAVIGFFACLILIWGSIMPLLWRQQESRFACKWGQYSNETSDPEHLENTRMDDFSNMAKVKKGKIHYLFEPEMERVEFRGRPKRSTIDGAFVKTDDELQRCKNHTCSWGLLLTVLIAISGITIANVILSFTIRYYLGTTVIAFKYGSHGFGVLNALCMLLMDHLSLWFLPMINDLENHRTNIAHRKAYFYKKLVFDFVVYYVPLLFLVIVVPQTQIQLEFLTCIHGNCLDELQVHFATIFVTLIVVRLLIYLYDFTCGKFSYRRMKRVPSTAYFKPFYDMHEFEAWRVAQDNIIPPSRQAEMSANEYLLYKYEDIQKPMNEFLIQFGYVVTFGIFFPWCAPIALLYDMLAVRLELHKLLVYSRRPFPEGANGIAPYNTAFKVVTFVAVAVLFYIFTVDSFELRIVGSDVRVFTLLLEWIALIAIYIVVYLLFLWLFPAVPKSSSDHIKRQMFVDQSIAANYSNMKEFQDSISVSSLLKLRQWTFQEVYDYFNGYGHPRYSKFAKLIYQHKIDGQRLLYLTKRDLQSFGIDDQYHRMWIEQEIESLKALHRHVNATIAKRKIDQKTSTVELDSLVLFLRNNRSHTGNGHHNALPEDEEMDDEGGDYEEEMDTHHDLQSQQQDIMEEEEEEEEEEKRQLNAPRPARHEQLRESSPSHSHQAVYEAEDEESQGSRSVHYEPFVHSEPEAVSPGNVNNANEVAYKSFAKLSSHETDNVTANNVAPPVSNTATDDAQLMRSTDVSFAVFGDIEIGMVTQPVADKNYGDILVLKEVIHQFQLVIKQHARVKLIQSYASKRLNVTKFDGQAPHQIAGLLELIISCVIRIKYKNNVEFDKSKLQNNADFNRLVVWIINDKLTMNGKAWNVDDFAEVFDQWIFKIIH